MTKNDELDFNPLLRGDPEVIAARVVRLMSEPALSFPRARCGASDATSEPAASEKAVTQEQI